MGNNQFIYLRILLFVSMTWIGIYDGYTQNSTYINFTVQDGLPSNETYSVFEDKDGYIWIGTDRGVCRYNGESFETFTTLDGLPGNTVFKFYEDHKGRLWFLTYNGKVGFYLDGAFHNLSDPAWDRFYLGGITVTKEDSVLLAWHDHFGPYSKFKLGKNNKIVGNVLTKNLDEVLDRNRDSIYDAIDRKTTLQDMINYNPSLFEFRYRLDFMHQRGFVKGLVMNRFRDGNVYLYNSDMQVIHRIDNPAGIPLINDVGILDSNFFITGSNRIAIIESKKGFKLIDKEQFKLFDPTFTTMDRFGGQWISTHNKGILYKPNPELKLEDFIVDKVSTMRSYARNEHVQVFADAKNNIYRLAPNGSKLLPTLHTVNRIQKVKYDKKLGRFYITAMTEFYILDHLGNVVRSEEETSRIYNEARKIKVTVSYNDMLETSKGEVIGSKRSYIFFGDSLRIFKDIIRSSCIISADPANDTVWVGSKNGLFATSIKEKKLLNLKKDTLLSASIVEMTFLEKKHLALITNGEGLLLKTGDTTHQITVKEGLLSGFLNHIASDGKRIVWVSSTKGVNKIEFDSFDPLIYTVSKLDERDGLLNKEIKDLSCFNDSLYILLEHSVLKLSKDYAFKTAPPVLHFRQLRVNSIDTLFAKDLCLGNKFNNIEIDFDALYYRNQNDLIYNYSLDGGETWQVGKLSKTIPFFNLSPDEYHFMLKAEDADGRVSNVLSYSFEIMPPWWQRWWAFLGYIGTLLGVFYVVFMIRNRRKLEKEEVRRKMVEMELKALRSQMNPHFTFNTMNSIQHFINANEPEEANIYISKFSRLMRMILDNSREEFITIEQEMDALRLYLEIEKLRFFGKFEFEIEMDEEIDEAFERIPPMVIQPFAENAIWHGLMTKDGPRNLIIKLELADEDGILCVVEDNGIGRKKAGENKSKFRTKHKSHGMNITQTRLELLNSMNKNKLESKIIDLTDEEGIGRGTRVEIYIPIK